MHDFVRVLYIDMAGVLPALVGALGAVTLEVEVPRRVYDRLAMRLGKLLQSTA